MHGRCGLALNTLHLKIMAVLFMLIDHVAYILIPTNDQTYLIMRIIGRLAAPLFWYCFVEGYRRTSDAGKYKIRLAVWALIMGIGNLIVNSLPNANCLPSLSMAQPNMFLTFLLMAVAIDAVNGTLKKNDLSLRLLWIAVLVIVLCVVVSRAEYNWFAAFSILCLYFIKNRNLKYTIFVVVNLFVCFATHNVIQIFAVFAIVPMILCSDQKPSKSFKWFFYLFYPLHFWVLCLIKLAIQYFL